MQDLNFIFIGGCPRSGTTLLASMLGNHADALVIPEALFKFSLHQVIQKTKNKPLENRKTLIFNHLKNHPRFKIWKIQITEAELFAGLNDDVGLQSLMTNIVRTYARQKGIAKDFQFVIDHDPGNARHGATLQKAFQNCCFIHLVRDGRAVAASVMRLDWGPNNAMAAAQYWVSNLSFGLALESFTSDCKRVFYEELVTQPELAMRGICEFAGLAFQEQVLHSTDSFLPDFTAQQHHLVGGALSQRNIYKWKEKLSPRDVEVFEYFSHDMLRYLGYEPENETPPAVSAYEKFKFRLNSLLKTRFNKWRHDRRLKR
jgi:hypothetical protein